MKKDYSIVMWEQNSVMMMVVWSENSEDGLEDQGISGVLLQSHHKYEISETTLQGNRF